MKRFVAVAAACSFGIVTAVGVNLTERAPLAQTASLCPEEMFFDALLRNPEQRLESRRVLQQSVLQPDPAPRHILLLGLNELWLAAENQPDSLAAFNHSLIALHWLRKAEKLLPEDERIPSWRLAAEWAVATAEHRNDDAAAAREKLRELAHDDPCFHSVAFGIMTFNEPTASEAFRQGHAAMEAAFLCGNDNPAIQDRPLWPHNVHAFLAALADFRLKAGDVRGAEAALVIAESRAGFDQWKHRALVSDRLNTLKARAEQFQNADADDDPKFAFARGGPVSCIGCHGE